MRILNFQDIEPNYEGDSKVAIPFDNQQPDNDHYIHRKIEWKTVLHTG